MKRIKSLITFLVVLMYGVQSLSAQDIPKIEDFEIDSMTINHTIGNLIGPIKFPLGKQHNLSNFTNNKYGFVVIPPSYYKHDGTSCGIVVTYDELGCFSACDTRCPNCYRKKHEKCNMKAVTIHGMLECPSCGAQVESLFLCSSGQLTAYDMGRDLSPMSLEMYFIEEEEKEGKTMLHIYQDYNTFIKDYRNRHLEFMY